MAAFVPAAQTIGIVGSGILSGAIASISYIGVPSLSHASPEVAVRQWKTMYNTGKASAPPLALITTTCFGYLAYQSWNESGSNSKSSASDQTRFYMYAATTLLIPAILPYTILRMEPLVNGKLMHMANVGEMNGAIGKTATEVTAILARWARMNFVRAAVVATGSLLGAIASIVY